MPPGRVIALDPGERWIGVAVSDDARRLALPSTTIDRRALASDTPAAIAAHIRDAIAPDTPGAPVLLVVGVPYDPAGAEDAQAADFRALGAGVAGALGLPLAVQGERYSNDAAPPSPAAPAERRRGGRRPGAVSPSAARASAAAVTPPPPRRSCSAGSTRSRRARRPEATHEVQRAWLISGALVAGLGAVAVLISLGSPGAVLDDLSAPPVTAPARSGETIVVEIPSGVTAEQIADELVRRGVIASSRQFQTLVGLLGYEDRLVVGTYDFEPGMLTIDVIERIRNGVTSEIVVTIPEGWQAAEIFDRIAEQSPLSAAGLAAAAAESGVAVGTLAAARPPLASLEGYLFPSTYVISRVATSADVVRQMLERFDERITAELRDEIAASGRSLHLLLTIASIVEREAVLPDERPVIASVFWNRIDTGLPLQADPTGPVRAGPGPGQRRALRPLEIPAHDGRSDSALAVEHVCYGSCPANADRLARPRFDPRRPAPGGHPVLLLRRPRRRRPPVRGDIRGAPR